MIKEPSIFLLKENCDFDVFVFKMNVPSASHMGVYGKGKFDQCEASFVTLLHLYGQQLDDESLRTFLYESAAIVNSRSFTVENVNDPLSATPLTPHHLLTQKSKVILPPPGIFQSSSCYACKRWYRVQYLVMKFGFVGV